MNKDTNMAKAMPINRREALYFFDVIYEPIIKAIQETPELKNFLQSRQECHHFMTKLGELYGYVLHDIDKIDESLQYYQHLMQEKFIPEQQIKTFLLKVLHIIQDSLKNYPHLDYPYQQLEENVQHAINHIDATLQENNESLHDGSFITAFDENIMDTQINDMHTSGKNREVLSAQDYLALGELDEEHILQIIDVIGDALSITMQSVTLSPADISELQNAIEEATHALEGAFEFMDLGNVLRHFSELLEQIKQLDENTREMYKPLIESFITDLEKWADHVFVKQDAIDIHYLDASLFSSVKQIELLLSTAANDNQNQEEEMDSFMF